MTQTTHTTPAPDVIGTVMFPPFTGWNGNAADNLPAFVHDEPMQFNPAHAPRISAAVVEIDGARYRIECAMLKGWNDGMRVISPNPTSARAIAHRIPTAPAAPAAPVSERTRAIENTLAENELP